MRHKLIGRRTTEGQFSGAETALVLDGTGRCLTFGIETSGNWRIEALTLLLIGFERLLLLASILPAHFIKLLPSDDSMNVLEDRRRKAGRA
jgi:hypothetical protein